MLPGLREFSGHKHGVTVGLSFEGKKITVVQYFELMDKKDLQFKRVFANGKLKYPKLHNDQHQLQTKPVMVTAQLVSIHCTTVKYAAVKPGEWAECVQNGGQEGGDIEIAVNVVKKDKNAAVFDVNPDDGCARSGAAPGQTAPRRDCMKWFELTCLSHDIVFGLGV
jgi:hypothetical protein